MPPASVVWPAIQEAPKTLLCLRVHCNVDDLFKTLVVNPELQAQLHQVRNDTNLVESPWVGSREQLPQPQYSWEAANGGSGGPAPGQWRKVRFNSPPTALATKPFNNEEVQCCVEAVPGQRYILEVQANTSAPYGDQFDIFFRLIILADSADTSFLRVVSAISWSPNINFMMKKMVGKAIEGGVDGTYKQYRKVLEGIHTVEDVPEATVQAAQAKSLVAAVPAAQAAPAPAAAAPAALAAAPTARVPAERAPSTRLRRHAAAPGPPGDSLTSVYGHVIWSDLVAVLSDVIGMGLSSMANEGLMAHVMAGSLMLFVLHVVVTILKSVNAFCAHAWGPMWLLCLPVTHVLHLPESLAQVLTCVGLVLLVNYAMLRGGKALISVVGKPGDQGGAGDETETVSGNAGATPLASASNPGALKVPAPVLETSGASNVASPVSGAGGAPAGAAAAAAAAAATVVAKNLAPRSNVPSPNNRGPRLVKQPGSSASNLSNASGPSAASTTLTAPPPAATKGKSATGSKGDNKPASRSSTPTRLDRQAGFRASESGVEMSAMGNSTGKGSASASGASGAGSGTAGSTKPQVQAGSGSGPGSPVADSTAGGTRRTPSGNEVTSPVAGDGAAGGLGGGAPHLLPSGGSGPLQGMGSGYPNQPPEPMKAWIKSMSQGIDALVGWGAAPTPGVPGAAGQYAKLPASPEGPGTADQEGSPSQLPVSTRAGGSVADVASSLPQPPAAGTATTGAGPFSFPPAAAQAAAAIAAAQAASGAGGGAGAGGRPALSKVSMGAESATGSQGPLSHLPPGREPDMYEEEIFENERFQPFRGWGHLWPGHFLPSDRVGHWGDRLGRPGGTASMIFEQVEPQLPEGWRWVEDAWQLDMEDFDKEAVDQDGWTYALDFNYLKYPPPVGTGKSTVKSFVRRRRFFRTRVRIAAEPAMPHPLPQQMSKDVLNAGPVTLSPSRHTTVHSPTPDRAVGSPTPGSVSTSGAGVPASPKHADAGAGGKAGAEAGHKGSLSTTSAPLSSSAAGVKAGGGTGATTEGQNSPSAPQPSSHSASAAERASGGAFPRSNALHHHPSEPQALQAPAGDKSEGSVASGPEVERSGPSEATSNAESLAKWTSWAGAPEGGGGTAGGGASGSTGNTLGSEDLARAGERQSWMGAPPAKQSTQPGSSNSGAVPQAAPPPASAPQAIPGSSGGESGGGADNVNTRSVSHPNSPRLGTAISKGGSSSYAGTVLRIPGTHAGLSSKASNGSPGAQSTGSGSGDLGSSSSRAHSGDGVSGQGQGGGRASAHGSPSVTAQLADALEGIQGTGQRSSEPPQASGGGGGGVGGAGEGASSSNRAGGGEGAVPAQPRPSPRELTHPDEAVMSRKRTASEDPLGAALRLGKDD